MTKKDPPDTSEPRFFTHVKPGDKVTRLISSEMIPMELTVESIHENLITCFGGWQFDANTGCEIDADLGWGNERTGSFLSAINGTQVINATPKARPES